MRLEKVLSQNSLPALLEKANDSFGVHFTPVKVKETTLDIVQIKDMPAYVDKLTARYGDKLTLPFWAKIWPSAVILAYFVQSLPADKQPRILELGCGVGVAGLIAASRGFQCTLSDISADALAFAKINILKNGLQKNATIKKVDFIKDSPSEKFDFIIASEILYADIDYRPLVDFLIQSLENKPGSEIIIVDNYFHKAEKFFSLAQDHFLISQKPIGFKPDAESAPKKGQDKHLCVIYRLKPKAHV